MGEEYRTKVFKSGNSVAVRLPKALGLNEGTEMILRKTRGKFELRPVEEAPKKIDLTGIYGSIPGLTREPFDERERDWKVSHDRD